MNSLTIFFSQPTLFIQQVKEWAEIIVNFETANKYKVEDSQGNQVGGIYEKGSGFIKMISRQFFRNHRPLDIDVIDKNSAPILQLIRPFFFFWSTLTILESDGKKMGEARRRFGFFIFKRYDLIDANGNLFGQISSPLWRIWTFKVICPKTEKEIATISKRWGGILKEAFTDADRFGVNFDSPSLTLEQKAVIFSTAITIDFDFFEDNQNNN